MNKNCEPLVEMFTDGACKGNPGPGGWGVLLRYRGIEKEIFGGEEYTTNNRMELYAVISGLQELKQSCQVIITTDSRYVQLGITEWIEKWTKKNWKRSDKSDIKNIDLWKTLYSITKDHKITWHWVKGHSGHLENERVDKLANLGILNLIKNV